MTTTQRILVLDDDADYGTALADWLQANGFTVRTEQDPAALEAALEAFAPDLLLLDQRLGSATGTEVLRRLRARSALPCIVWVTSG